MEQLILDLRNEVIELRKKIKNLQKEESGLTKKLREKCSHETIYETPYQPETLMFNTRPPRKICIICGESEEGWDCGYEKLKNEPVRSVPDEEFNELWKLKPLVPRMIVGG